MNTLARAPGGQMPGAATQAMSDIVEHPEQARDASFPERDRPAGFVARSLHTAPDITRRLRLSSAPGGPRQNANLSLREPLPRTIETTIDTNQSSEGTRHELFFEQSPVDRPSWQGPGNSVYRRRFTRGQFQPGDQRVLGGQKWYAPGADGVAHIVAWTKLAELAKPYLTKGRQVYVE